jgi:hypothetical protein
MFPLTKLEIGSHCSSIFSSTRWIVSTNLFIGLVPRYLSGRIIDIHLPTRFGFLSWYPIKGVYKSLQLGTDRLHLQQAEVPLYLRMYPRTIIYYRPNGGELGRGVAILTLLSRPSQKGHTSAF